MKFTVDLVAKSTARLGSLSEFNRIPEAVLETPLLLLHTRVTFNIILNLFFKAENIWLIIEKIFFCRVLLSLT